MKRQLTILFFSAALVSLLLYGCGGSPGGGGIVGAADSTGDDNSPGDLPDSLNIENVLVPGGNFNRGRYNADDWEAPPRTVNVDSFWISKTEITNEQYCYFLNDGNESHYYGDMRIHRANGTFEPFSSYENHPVVYIDYASAVAFCNWAGGRLPTEAEWEKAARGDSEDLHDYPWGNEIPTVNHADFSRNGVDATTMEVGRFTQYASPYGVYDMAGSVFEWCHDWFYGNYYSFDESLDNPTGPETGTVRVIRGGSYRSSNYEIRTSYRQAINPENRVDDLGFRIVWGD